MNNKDRQVLIAIEEIKRRAIEDSDQDWPATPRPSGDDPPTSVFCVVYAMFTLAGAVMGFMLATVLGLR